jgi:hypothetical protein
MALTRRRRPRTPRRREEEATPHRGRPRVSGDASRAGQGHRGVRPGGVGRGGGGARRDDGVGGLKRRRRTDGDDLTHIDGRCRLAEGRTRGGSLPLTALIGSIDLTVYYESSKQFVDNKFITDISVQAKKCGREL